MALCTGCTLPGAASAQRSTAGHCRIASNRASPVILATATSAEPAPGLSPGALDLLRRAADPGPTCVLLLTAQGEVRSLALTPLRGTEVEHGPARRSALERNLAAVDQAVAAQAATENGLDPLGRLQAAARLPTAGPLIVITSGISTQPPLDLQRLGLDVDPGLVTEFLRDQGELPRFDGRDVLLTGLGQSAGRQPPLRQGLRERLTALWLEICRSTGARRCATDPGDLAPNPPRATNQVPVVAPPSIPELPNPAASQIPPPLPIPAAALFDLGSARLTPTAASRLAPIAQRIRSTGLGVRVRGCTDASTGTLRRNTQLATARALAVADALGDLGVPAAQLLAAQGGGTCGATRAEEAANPELIARHRRVDLTFSREES